MSFRPPATSSTQSETLWVLEFRVLAHIVYTSAQKYLYRNPRPETQNPQPCKGLSTDCHLEPLVFLGRQVGLRITSSQLSV